MGKVSIFQQIKNTLERLKKDFVESKNFNLGVAILAFTAGVLGFATYFSGLFDKHSGELGNLIGVFGAFITSAFLVQLKEYIRDKRKVSHIVGLQNEIPNYDEAESEEDKKFFEERFWTLLRECLKY